MVLARNALYGYFYKQSQAGSARRGCTDLCKVSSEGGCQSVIFLYSHQQSWLATQNVPREVSSARTYLQYIVAWLYPSSPHYGFQHSV